MKKHICCLCDKEFEGYGNNPYPISTNENDTCCNDCNMSVVIPARMEMLAHKFELLNKELKGEKHE